MSMAERFGGWAKHRHRCARWLLVAMALPLAAQAGDVLRLKSGTRDPLSPGGDAFAAEALGLDAASGGLYVVQAQGPIDARLHDALVTAGARILGYLPDDAYLIRASPAVAGTLGGLGGVRSFVPYRAIDRLDPALVSVLASPEAHTPAPVLLRVNSTVDAHAEALAARAQAAAPGVVLTSLSVSASGRAALVLNAPRAALVTLLGALAVDPAVEFVEPTGRLRLLNDDTAWVLQTGTANDYALFASAGLTGVGQVVALADMGIDRDACEFTYDGGPGTAANLTQPPNSNVTNPNDKVIAYYQITGADVYDSAAVLYHGSRVAGCIAGDNGIAPATLAPRTAPYTFAHDRIKDRGDGMAPGAQLVVQDIGTSDGFFVEGLNQAGLLTQAYGSKGVGPIRGARVHNSSYGERPEDTGAGKITRYGGESAGLDETLWRMRDMTSVFAAGNWGAVNPVDNLPWDGFESLAGLGAVAKNTITVGSSAHPAVGNLENVAPESSRGPTLEGLLKPDVVAPGHSLTAVGNDTTNPSCAPARLTQLGTSFAAGAVSGMAALVRQYFTDGYWPSGQRTRLNIATDPEAFDPSNALVKAVLINSARSLKGANTADRNSTVCATPSDPGCSAPSFGQGWGRVTLGDTLEFPSSKRKMQLLFDIWNGSVALENRNRGVDKVDPTLVRGALSHRETHSYSFAIAAATQPLRCTLVWSDPPPSPAASAPLVNDLNLELHDPADRYFHGNQFFADRPFTDPAQVGLDATNPVENIWVENPGSGIYNLRVHGRSVPGDGLSDVLAEPATALSGPTRIDSRRQGYALLCSGDALDIKSPPIVTITANPSPAVGCVEDNFEVEFTANCTTCPTCEPCLKYDWDFGDGPPLLNVGQVIVHPYTGTGLYLVSVTARTASGIEGRSSFPEEIIVGDKNQPKPVGNSLRLLRQPNPIFGDAKVFWADIGVPQATSYGLYEFDNKRDVASFSPGPPSSVPLGRSKPPPFPAWLHGDLGPPWTLAPPLPNNVAGIRFLQVRSANCEGNPGP